MTVFLGQNKSQLMYSRNAIESVNVSLMKVEPALYNIKWWDYRLYHPTEATYLFAHEYVRAVKAAYRRRKSHSGVVKALKNDNFLKCAKTTISGMWKARQAADRYGVKYDFWCRSAMTYAEEYNWRYIPKPQQLYVNQSSEGKHKEWRSMLNYIVYRWRKRCSETVQTAEFDFYKVKNFTSPLHSYQKQHMSDLLEAIDGTQNKAPLICDLVFERGVLIPALITAKYGREQGGNLLKRAETLRD